MKKIILLLFAIFSSWQINAQVSAYAFSQSTAVYTPLVGGTVVAAYTNPTTGNMDDVIYNLPATTIPFTFTYNAVGYDGLNVSSNGFISFGTLPPTSATYVPLSVTTTYAGAISAFGRDLEGGFVFTGNTTSGSPTIDNVSNIGTAQVGDFISGSGIPALTTITAITGATVTMSANATATGTLVFCQVGGTSSNIQYGVEGVAPNRVFVVQYSNFKRYGTSVADTQHMTLNFQIRLSETSNAINVVYGNCSPGLTTSTTVIQVGLRGASNAFATNVNNRLNAKSTSDWATSLQGSLNTSGQLFNNTTPANVIPTGLTYTWLPPVPCTGTPTGGIVTPATRFICSGSSPGTLTASGFSGGVSGLLFQWEQSPDGVAWVDAVGGTFATTSVYTPPTFLGTPLQYRMKVTCSNSNLFAYSTPSLISTSSPNTQVTNANITNIGSATATVNWINGNGTRRVSVLSNSPTIVDPINGNAAALVANPVYSGTGQQIIYDGTAVTVPVTGGLTQNTTYYVKVYEYLRCGTGPYDYYYNTTTGTNVATFTTIASPLNDNCSGAVSLTVGANFAANAIVSTNIGASASQLVDSSIPAPGCALYSGGDLWYSVTVPSTGNIIIETGVSVGSPITDTGMAVYSGLCNALVLVLCNDDIPLNDFSRISLTARTPGEVLYVRVWEYGNNAFGNFQVSAYDCPSGTPAPMGAAAQSFCTSATVANLVTTSGTGIKWYATPTSGTALLPTDALVSGNIYYASQTTTPGCEGLARLAVTVTIDTVLPTTPTGAAVQTFCSANSPTLASLAVNGTGLVWYDAATLGNVLPSTTLLTATTYYVASSAGSCVSSRLAITTTNICTVAPCFNGGIYPTLTYTPTTCNGLIQNVITTLAWPGEYSNVNVTTGQTYVFGSSVATDIITISADAAVTAVATGTGTATWVSTLTGVVRFYIHLAACGASEVNRTRYVICGIPSLALPDYVNLQFPATATFPQGGNVTVYGQVYEAGLTDVVPNVAGQAPGIQAWFGISTTNTNPNTWTNWVPATWNSSSVGNNDEYQATIGATLLPGTYYYATRFNLDNGAYVYGGINASAPNNGNFWDGATFGSGVLTITPPPAPANDECSGALTLIVNPNLLCGSVTAGSILGATASTVDATACGGTEDDDVWFSFVASSTSHSIALNNVLGSTTDLYHSLWTGTNCSSLTLVPGTCSDPNTSTPTGLVVGQTYYLRIYSWTATTGQTSTFNICIGTPPPPPANDECSGAIALTPGGVYADNDIDGTNISATLSANTPIPTCGNFNFATSAKDVWYSVIVPASGSLTIGTGVHSSLAGVDTVFSVYSGDCNTLTQVGCDDDSDPETTFGLSRLVLTGQTPGATFLIRLFGYNGLVGLYSISAYDASLGNNTFDNANFSYYPNPVKNTLNLSYSQEISSVEVYNLIGQKVRSISNNANEVQVDMSNLPSAAYIVKVTSNNQVKTIKVIKE